MWSIIVEYGFSIYHRKRVAVCQQPTALLKFYCDSINRADNMLTLQVLLLKSICYYFWYFESVHSKTRLFPEAAIRWRRVSNFRIQRNEIRIHPVNRVSSEYLLRKRKFFFLEIVVIFPQVIRNVHFLREK